MEGPIHRYKLTIVQKVLLPSPPSDLYAPPQHRLVEVKKEFSTGQLLYRHAQRLELVQRYLMLTNKIAFSAGKEVMTLHSFTIDDVEEV